MSINLTNIYVSNFEKFLNNNDVRLDKNYYQKLYKTIYSKRTNTNKIHEALLNKITIVKKNNKSSSTFNKIASFFGKKKPNTTNSKESSNVVNENNVSNNINERKNKKAIVSGGEKVWIDIVRNLINELKNSKISSSWDDAIDTSFNSFKTKYNTLIDNILYYENVVLKDISNGTNSFKLQRNISSITESTFESGNPNKYSIENIYDNIVKNGVVKMDEKNKNDHSLYYYYNKMVKKTKDANTKKYDYSIKIVGTNKSNINATNKNGKFLAKFRKIKFGSDKELHISVLYYKIRKVGQILMLLLPTIIYYYNKDKYIVNESLRKELLHTILILRSLIARSNLNDPTNNSQNSQKHKSIRNAFRRVLQNDYANANSSEIKNLFKNSIQNKSNKEVRLYINKLIKLIKILVPEHSKNKINELLQQRIKK